MPHITTSALQRADGSATFTSNLYSILAGVNGPVEVQRRDELPEEAYIEVNIRPGSGVGTPRERYLESIVASVLRSVILVHLHPRMLIQVTLQVLQEPSEKLMKGKGEVAVLPSLLNAAFLALVDGGIPLETTMSAVLVAVDAAGGVVAEPSIKELLICQSVHALAYDLQGELVMDQSTGVFDMGIWEGVAEVASERCKAAVASTEDTDEMRDTDESGEPWLRTALEEKVRAANAWREQT
ncbi:hypothetical protein B0A48_04201 [Cryoendolithus antarcticus]|uniref:Exoribonuclease phosphorolytic domain-containing protein n=1 Tax=Cryoendolithus antarcticus TaxID=1507870 RepID=A0A1V8TEN7_9PEZI|nr:hypothetical protein B0A48_04201 [Cryoendolithus antarcticus]